jgi:hypothetical protein
MKRLILIFALIFPLTIALAGDWMLVRVLAPQNPAQLENTGFTLFHRAGDYWIGSLPAGSALPMGGMVLQGYDPAAGDLYQMLFIIPGAESDKLTGNVNLLYNDGQQAIFQATEDQLAVLPAIRGELVLITLTPKSLRDFDLTLPSSIDEFNPVVQDFINQVSQTQYNEYLQTLQNFGTRNSRTAQCDSAAVWIYNTMQSFGLTVSYDYFTLSTMQKRNVIGQRLGTLHPDSIVFITAHYDATAGSPGSPEPVAPGADDNASGTACVLECARILSQYSFDKTIRFCAFAGEEQGLVGSNHYVQTLQQASAHVVGSFNWDMIAWSGADPLPSDLIIYANTNARSQALANKIAEAVTTYLPGVITPVVIINGTMTGSDHAPFWNAGWGASCGIEEQAWGPDFNLYYHTVNDLITNCDLPYAANCTRAAIAALADYAIPITAAGPLLTIQNKVIDDVGGNGNGVADPGETVSILVTLINAGNQPATTISGTLVTTSPYAAVTQATTTYPNLGVGATGTGAQAYMLNVSGLCPLNTWINATLTITAAGGYTHAVPLSFLVGDPVYYPTGPDQYGYSALDNLDVGGPVYNWIEVDPFMGGQGTTLNFTVDDQVINVTLPFTFRYYGANYTEASVSTDGWLAMGPNAATDHTNSRIPNADGPSAMLAPFWEDLSPQQPGGHVATYYDANQHTFVVEWDSVRQYSPTTARETFEVVLYDPAYHITPTGDGKILFQYKKVSDPTNCTVGIENLLETDGLEYLYNTDYHPNAAHLGDGMAILYILTTSSPQLSVTMTPINPPIVVPANGGSFNFNATTQRTQGPQAAYWVWARDRYPDGSYTGNLLGPVNINPPVGVTVTRQRTQVVPSSWPSGLHYYIGYANATVGYPAADADSFSWTKSATADGGPEVWGARNFGESFAPYEVLPTEQALPTAFGLDQNRPNPFNPVTAISYKLQAASHVSLKVYDVTGRMVANLVNGWQEAGNQQVTFDGTRLSSGLYFVKMQAGEFSAVRKMMLVK